MALEERLLAMGTGATRRERTRVATPAAGAGRRPAGRVLTAAPRLLLIALTLVGFFALGVPLQAWLQRRRRPAEADRLLILFCRTLLRLVGVTVEVRGAPAAGAVLVAANHVSWIDILALAGIAPFCFLSKAEVACWPLISSIVAVQGTVFIDRRRRRSIIPANRAMAARLGEGRRVLFFPEGTTLAGPLPGPFLSSHFAAAQLAAEAMGSAAVQPVAILYSSPAAAWVGDDTLLGHLWRTLLAPPLRCTISFGELLPIRRDINRKTVAIQARATISALIAGAAPPGAPPDASNDALACRQACLYAKPASMWGEP